MIQSALMIGIVLMISLGIFAINAMRKVDLAFIIILFAFTVQLSLAVLNNFVFVLPGASEDAIMFVDEAVLQSGFVIGTELYLHSVAVMHLLGDKSGLLPSIINVLASLWFLFILRSLFLRYVVPYTYYVFVFLVYSLDPYRLIIMSVPLRESFISLGLALLCFGIITKQKLPTLLGFFTFPVWHKVLPIMTLSVGLANKFKVNFTSFTIGIAMFVSLSYLGSLLPNIRAFEVLRLFATGDFMFYVENYRRSGESLAAEMTYNASRSKSALDFILYFLYYNFMPLMPTSISALYVTFWAWVRLTFFVWIIWRWKYSCSNVKFLVNSYVSIAFLWALGTTNYGTGARHHITHDWLLLLAVGILLSNIRSRKVM